MKEIKRLKFNEPHKFKKKANEDHFEFNQKLSETFNLYPPSSLVSRLVLSLGHVWRAVNLATGVHLVLQWHSTTQHQSN